MHDQVENPMVINDPLLWKDELTGYYEPDEKSNYEDGTMESFEITNQKKNETVYDHTKELRSFYEVLKKYSKALAGSRIYEDLLEAYEEVGERIAEMKKENHGN